jgi:hypothetical protein
MPGFKCVKTVDTLIVLFVAFNENEPAGGAILIKHLILEFGQYVPSKSFAVSHHLST